MVVHGFQKQVPRRPPPKGRVYVDGAIAYATVVLDNGVVVHLTGENHIKPHTCAPCALVPGTSGPCMTSLAQYAADLAVRARKTRRRLDVFLEQWMIPGDIRPRGKMYTSHTYIKHDSSLTRLYLQFGNTRGRSGVVRTHWIDIRDKHSHPQLDAHEYLKQNYAVKNASVNETRAFQKVVETMLRSNRYSDNMQLRIEDYARLYPRNATTFDGADVSRLRKSLLKLRPDVRDKLIDKVGALSMSYDHPFDIMSMLVDAYAVARMLYYAGYGTTRPVEGTSAVQFSHAGAFHTVTQYKLLQASGVVASASRLQHVEKGCVHAPVIVV